MGFFSWMFADKNNEKRLRIGRRGYIACPDGTFIKEDLYDGYGEFDGKDIYELVVMWNREFLATHPEHTFLFPTMKASDFGWYPYLADLTIKLEDIPALCPEEVREVRSIGVDIACYDFNNASLPYPIKITATKKIPYCELPPSKHDPNQGV